LLLVTLTGGLLQVTG